jgi:uncharacterized protein YjdB
MRKQFISTILAITLCISPVWGVEALPSNDIESNSFESETGFEDLDIDASEEASYDENTKKCGDNLTYTLSGTTLTISGSGSMYNYNYWSEDKKAPWADQSFTKVVIQSGVTSIGNEAFFKCSSLSEVSLPDGLIKIGSDAFNGCTSLRAIRIPSSVTELGDDAFLECKVLTDVELPSNLKRIKANTFQNCEALVRITIPDSINTLDKYCFANCYKLEDVQLPARLTTIGEGAFTYCRALKSVFIPEKTVTIADEVFDGCRALQSVDMATSSVEVIKEGTFKNCVGLQSLTLPSSLKEIEDDAFEGASVQILCFKGDAVVLGEASFNGVDGTAYTPVKNTSWEGTAGKEYGGSVTWKLWDPETGELDVIPIEGITLDKGEMKLYEGDANALTAKVLPENATFESIQFFSSDESVATVDTNGLVTAVSAGNAVITATVGDGFSDFCKVSVFSRPVVKLNVTKKTIYTAGSPNKVTLSPKVTNGKVVSVSYKSSAPKIAYVNKSGVVSSKGAGSATITATVKADNGAGEITKKLTCQVTVKKPTLKVSPTSVSLAKGKSKTLSVKAVPKGDISYKTSNKKVATVTANGKITAKGKGTATITVKCNGVKKTVKVTVK